MDETYVVRPAEVSNNSGYNEDVHEGDVGRALRPPEVLISVGDHVWEGDIVSLCQVDWGFG